MPQVKDPNVKDGWYVNMAMHEDKPRPLSLGAVYTLKPGQEKFLRAEMILQSRATYSAFKAALANGNLVPKNAAPVPVSEPEPEPEVIDQEERVEVADDEEPEVTAYGRGELQAMNKSDLIEIAENMALDNDGTRAELVDRILVSQE